MHLQWRINLHGLDLSASVASGLLVCLIYIDIYSQGLAMTVCL
jgi:hypothetical protein